MSDEIRRPWPHPLGDDTPWYSRTVEAAARGLTAMADQTERMKPDPLHEQVPERGRVVCEVCGKTLHYANSCPPRIRSRGSSWFERILSVIAFAAAIAAVWFLIRLAERG